MKAVLWFFVILLFCVLQVSSQQCLTGQQQPCSQVGEACCNGVCKSCLSGNPTFQCDSSCTGCDSNCITFTATCGCSLCRPGYTVQSDGISCAKCNVKNCTAYDNQCHCSDCGPGLTTGDGTACTPCQVQHCTEFNSGCNCVACDPGWTSSHSDGCQPCLVNNCLPTSYDQNCLCTECKAGFAVSEGSCSQCTEPQCATYTQGPNCVCNSCNAGFTLVQSSCQDCKVFQCTGYSEGCSCSKCATGYVVSGTTCAEQPCNVIAPGNGTLGDCPTGPLPSESSCSVGCNTGYKLVGTVTTCSKGSFTATQSCTDCGVMNCKTYSTGCRCGVCDTGFTLNPSNFACDDCGVANCMAYSTGCQCQTCASQYVVNNGVCIGQPCDFSLPLNAALNNCPTNSILSSGASCQFICNAGFQFPVNSPVSTSCALGILKRQYDCQACGVTECQTYTTGCNCGACYPGFALSGNACLESPCAVSPPAHGSLGSCAATIASRDSCTIACDPGYTVAGAATTNCTLGAIQLPKQFCQACTVSSCLDYSVSCLCDQCVTGMKASKGLCIPCGVDQCSSYKSGCFCGKCNTGYSVTPQGLCAESPCTVTPPSHGSLGGCPSQLPSRDSCSVACGPGYFTTGTTGCLQGSLTSEQSCAACTVANCVSYSVGCICKKCSFPYKVKTADGTCEVQDPFLYQCGQTVFDHSVFGKPADVEPAYLIECPTSPCNGKIWGTDYYTVDSDVCTALRHSTGSTGGYAIMEFDYNTLSHRFNNFVGSSKNGVQSNDYDDSISISFHLTKYTPPPPILVESDSFSLPVHTPPLAKVPPEAFLELLVRSKHGSKRSGRPKK